MYDILFFTITVPLAFTDENYQDTKEFLDKEMESSQDGVFCCDKTTNLIINGNFENGNANFDSSYTYDSDILPGHYLVTNDATDFMTNVADHSYCKDPYYQEMNDKYMLVNSRTNQRAGSKSVIWHQEIENLEKEKWYRFCANFKNLQQSPYDLLPVVNVELSTGFSQRVTIDTDQDNPCDWQQMSFCFVVKSRVSIWIMLEESPIGVGNVLAIDDVSVQELGDPQLTTSLRPYNSNTLYGSLNTISEMDDLLPLGCSLYFWFVFTLQSYSDGTFSVNWSAPRGWGNSMGSVRVNQIVEEGRPWLLSTSFPGFVFLPDTFYAIGMVTPRCCEACLISAWTYHVFHPSGSYTTNYGLTEMDRFDLERWVGTSQLSSVEKEVFYDPRDQLP